MPVSNKKQEQQENREQAEGSIEDEVYNLVTMYPVFCTTNIPSKILDEFIDEAYEGWFDLVGVVVSGASPCILQTTDLDSITHGSRKPMPNFEPPFLNKTDAEIREWMLKHRHPNFTHSTFTILDQNTIDRKICRIGYVSEKYPDDRMLWTDFYADLYVRVPIKMATISWEYEDLVGTEEVLNRKVIREEDKHNCPPSLAAKKRHEEKGRSENVG